jgi:hypothetical protein
MAWAAAEADGRVQVGAGRPKLGNNSQIIADPRVYFAKQFGSNVTAPCGRITHGVISGATPHPEPPMPLQLNDEEMSVLMSLAGPIDQQRRPQFLQEVAQELEVKRQAGEVGEGLVHRLARQIQRKYWDPPQISPNATAPVHRGHAA